MTASLADSSNLKTPWDPNKTPYPPARRSDTVEYFQSAKAGKKVPVADPYDWLHDPDSQETKQFVQQQGEFTQQYLDQYKHKDQFTRELRKNWNYPRCAFPSPSRDARTSPTWSDPPWNHLTRSLVPGP